ncbi:winged helix-turn-helix domain-containing protein [Glutamicibacter sp. JC586]|uniref:winged helix-turn-helix domain-containing protein n=1 Tax=Glutamicibacter sp. JC586 TaxID=2590552 RepID=UPI0013569E7E|nr:winged helix-turn-helix domain-containing protein [Glutamicibacter sp. JC586]
MHQSSGSTSANISEVLYQEIISGKYKPGMMLPSQRDLASQFEASMASERTALSSLAGVGLFQTKPGKGSLVLSVSTGKSHFDGWLGAA